MIIFNKIETVIGLSSEDVNEFNDIFSKSIEQFFQVEKSVKPIYKNIIEKWNASKKADFIVFIIDVLGRIGHQWSRQNQYSQEEWNMARYYFSTLLLSKIKLSEENIISIYQAFKRNTSSDKYLGQMGLLQSKLFMQIENSFSSRELPDSIRNILNEITSVERDSNSYFYKDELILDEKIKIYLYKSDYTENAIKPAYFLGNDGFKKIANELIDAQKASKISYWFQLITLAQKSTGGKPTQKYLNEAKVIIDKLGSDNFKKVTQEWFNYIIRLKETTTTHSQTYNNHVHTYEVIEFLSSINADAIKGFVWMSSLFYDNTTIQIISKLSERTFKKIPGKGSAAAGIGNACLYTLYASEGLDGIAQLSRLKLKIKQANTLTLIEKYIAEAAGKLGISSIELEDLSVDDWNISKHQRKFDFEAYSCILELTGIGKSTLKWFKEDGSPQKTVPLAVKEKFADKLANVKDIQKQIDQTTSSQKERFDRMLRSNRIMSLEYFTEKYLNHALISFVINKVIFNPTWPQPP